MDIQGDERPHGSTTPPLSSSHASSNEHLDEPEPKTPNPAIASKRSSSVRFQDDMLGEHSSTPRRRVSGDTDEITPIRQADGHQSRSYKTTEQDRPSRNQNRKSSTSANNVQTSDEERPGVFKRIAEKYGSVTLDNKGSVARDHLALERTFLAWLRISLAFASIGIAITQLFRLNTSLNNHSQRRSMSYSEPQSSLLPLSPLIGHGLPPELIPFLQQLVQSAAPCVPTSAPSNTLLDQLILAPSLNNFIQPALREQAFNEGAAAKLRHVGKPLGATFIAISMIVLLTGFHRYFEAQFWIMRGKFPASRGSVALIGLIAGALIVSSLVVVLVVAPVSYEKR